MLLCLFPGTTLSFAVMMEWACLVFFEESPVISAHEPSSDIKSNPVWYPKGKMSLKRSCKCLVWKGLGSCSCLWHLFLIKLEWKIVTHASEPGLPCLRERSDPGPVLFSQWEYSEAHVDRGVMWCDEGPQGRSRWSCSFSQVPNHPFSFI